MKNYIECTSSELDYFHEQPIENIIKDGIYEKILPTIKTPGQIQFDVPPSQHFLDLSKSNISIRLKIINKDKTELSDTSKVGPVNNTFHSLIKQTKISLNNVAIENSNSGYAARAYISAALNHGFDAKSSVLQNSMFIPDTPGQFENFTLPKAITKLDETFPIQVLNDGYIQRRKILIDGKGFLELRGTPESDIFTNGKFILSQQKLSIELLLNDPKFFLMGSGDYTFDVDEAYFWVKKVLPNDNLVNSIELHMDKQFANYTTTKTNVIIQKIETKGLSHDFKILDGILPKRVIFAMADYEAITQGQIDKNPFNFQHYNLTSFELRANGKSIPYSHPLSFDFDNNKYLDGYWSIFEGIDKPFLGNSISREAYAGGNMFLAFDLTPNGECEPFKTASTNGSLSVSLQWSKEPKMMGLIIYMEFDNTILVDKFRNIIKSQ